MFTRTMVDVYSCTCDKCGHVWRSEELSARCPKCKAPGWDTKVNTQVQKATKMHPGDVVETENYPPEPEITSEDAEAFMVDLQPKTRQSTASVTPIVKERTRTDLPKPAKKKDKAARQAEKQEAKRKGKDGYCPHNFILLEGGVTACPQCK
jgi:hypothetical protein